MRQLIVSVLIGLIAGVVFLAVDLMIGPRIGPPLWTCVSSGPQSTHLPKATGELSDRTEEVRESSIECRDRVGVPLALIAFVVAAAMTYRVRTRRV